MGERGTAARRDALAPAAAYGLAYLALNELGVRLAVPPAGFSVFWPAAGLAVAVFLGAPRSWWPALALAQAAANLFGNLAHGTPIEVTVWFVAANLIESMVGAALVVEVRRRRGTRSSVTKLFGLPFVALFLATGFAAVVAASALVIVGDVGGGFWSAWRTWWVADAVGILAVAPIVVFREEFAGLVRRRAGYEALASLVVTWSATWFTFGTTRPHESPLGIVLLILPALLWPAIRLGRGVTGAAFFGAVVIAVSFTANDRGPFADPDRRRVDNAVDVQLFLSVLGASMLAVALAVELLRRAERASGMMASARAERDRLETVLAETAAISKEREELLSRATLLAEVSEVLDQAMTADAQLVRLAEIMSGRLKVWCGIDLLVDDPSGRLLVPHTQAGPVHIETHARPVPTRFPHNVAVSGEPVLVERIPPESLRVRVSGDDRFEALSGLGLSSAVLAPITSGGTVYGLFNLVSLDPDVVFDEGSRTLAFDIGRRAGQALRNAYLFEREREISTRLQASLLPESLPNHPGVQLAARYLPGEEGLDVGGDWYDAFFVSDDLLGIAVGDVVGGGLEAASATGQLRSAVRALARRCDGPADVLSELDAFAAAVPGADVATLVYVELELGSGTFRYACAGHPPPLIVGDGGATRFLEGGRSTPFATVAHPRRVEAVDRLAEGETLLLFTDGLFERRGETLDDGLDRLAEAATDHVGAATLDTVIDGVVRRQLHDRGAADDVCIVAVLRPASDPFRFRQVFAGDAVQLGPVRRDFRRWMRSHSMDETIVADVLLATFEAAANSVEHAYHGRRTGSVSIDARLEDGTIVVEVYDQGSWRLPSAPGDRGRGTSLMRAAMDSADVVRSPAGTRVELRRRVG